MNYEDGMALGEYIQYLEEKNPRTILPVGLGNPQSYRGYYECLAFEKIKDITVARMIKYAQFAVGGEYQGYKGGTYSMDTGTECFVASMSESGRPLTRDYLDGLFENATLEKTAVDDTMIANAINDLEEWLNTYDEVEQLKPLVDHIEQECTFYTDRLNNSDWDKFTL